MEDVIVVGGGPVGLILALELALAGAYPLVLERDERIDPTIKAGSLNGPAADALRRRGLAIDDQPPTVSGQRRPSGPPRFVGHVAGMPISPDLVRYEELKHSAESVIAGVSQQRVQELAADRLADLGIETRRGVRVTAVVSEGDRARVTTIGDAGEREYETGWVVGADGGRSTVRKSAGFGFPGLDGIMTGYQVLVEGERLDEIPIGWQYSPTGVYRRFPTNLILTAAFDGPPDDRSAPVTTDELTAAIRHVTGIPATVTGVRSATRFTDNTRVADRYRRGRVLLAGDAAHVHPPFGGQGLSLGILDAAALGWRLAGVATGRLPESALEDYERERRPEAERILEWSRAQVGLMRTDERSRAAARLVRRLMDTRDGATEAVRVVAGDVVSYATDEGPVGTFAPNWPGPDGASLFDAMADGGSILAYRPGTLPPATRTGLRAFATDSAPATLVLVRQDGVIAWQGEDHDGLEAAVTELGV